MKKGLSLIVLAAGLIVAAMGVCQALCGRLDSHSSVVGRRLAPGEMAATVGWAEATCWECLSCSDAFVEGGDKCVYCDDAGDRWVCCDDDAGGTCTYTGDPVCKDKPRWEGDIKSKYNECNLCDAKNVLEEGKCTSLRDAVSIYYCDL